MSLENLLIPFNKLESGFNYCQRHIDELLKSSNSLYDKNHYSSSLAITILAVEENSKLNLILKCIIEKRGITKKEWIEITGRGSHNNKLIKNMEERRRELLSLTYDDYLREVDRSRELGFDVSSSKSFEVLKAQSLMNVTEQIKKFNLVKQDCFYLNWNGKDWYSFITHAPKNIQKAFAYVNLQIATNEWANIVLKHKYLDKSWSDKAIVEQFRKEPLLEIAKKQSKQDFVNDMKKKIRLSYTYFEQTYLKKQSERNNQ